MSRFEVFFCALLLGSFVGEQLLLNLTLCPITLYYNLQDDLTRRVLIFPLLPVRESSCAAPCSELTSCASCIESALKCTWFSANVRVNEFLCSLQLMTK